MQYFYQFAYQNRARAEAEYQRRITAPTLRLLPFTIKPMKQATTYQLYYLPTDDMLRLLAAIYQRDAQLHAITAALPQVALDSFVRESLLDELQNTNDLEGVRSTRKELSDGLNAAPAASGKTVRFAGMGRAYFSLLYGDPPALDRPEDLRQIYDELTEGEIAPDDLPDGLLFRKGPVMVNRVSGKGIVVHEGVLPEQALTDGLRALLTFLKDGQIPPLLRIAIGHYYFGYLHPFYDGNGRTGRYLSNVLILRELSKFSAISLSRGCNMHRVQYAKLFENSSKAVNRGEMNAFIEGFLDLLLQGQSTVLQELQEKRSLLASTSIRINEDAMLAAAGEAERAIVYVMAQNYFFADDAGLEVKDLKQILLPTNRLSDMRLRAALKQLAEQGILRAQGKKPVRYHLSRYYAENGNS